MFNKHSLYPIFGGRWQPFHNGHLWAVKEIIKKYKHVIIMFVNIDPTDPPAKRFDRFHLRTNPLDYWERYYAVMNILIAEGLWQHAVIVPGWHPREIIKGEQFCLPPKSKRVWMVPVNSEEELSKINDLEDRGEIVERMEQIPSKIMGLNATVIRSAIINHQEDWNQYVPQVMINFSNEINIKAKIQSVYDSQRFMNSVSTDISTVICVGEFIPFSNEHMDFLKSIANAFDNITLAIILRVDENSEFNWPKLTYTNQQTPLNYWDICQLIRAGLVDFPDIDGKIIIHPLLARSTDYKLNLNNLPQNREWYFLNQNYRFIEDDLIYNEETVNSNYFERQIDIHALTETLFNSVQESYVKSINLNNRLRSINTIITTDYKKAPTPPLQVDIGIVTIVTSEKIAVKDCLKDSYEVSGKINSHRRFTIGNIKGKDGYNHTVALFSQVEEGQTAANLAYKSLATEFNPKILFLIGIGGSIDKKVEKCDVVIADKVIYYEIKKETTDGDVRSERSLSNSNYVGNLIDEFFERYSEFPSFKAVEHSKTNDFKVFRGPIGSGETVVTQPDSSIISYLKRVDRKTLCVEMEAYGFANAYADESPQLKRKGVVIIRGISDKPIESDDDKDIFRKACCDNAVQVMVKIINLIPKL